VFRNVAGSGENFKPTDDRGELVFQHNCPSGEALSLSCVSQNALANAQSDSWLTRSKELELETDVGQPVRAALRLAAYFFESWLT
jgi:hypothetical protein